MRKTSGDCIVFGATLKNTKKDGVQTQRFLDFWSFRPLLAANITQSMQQCLPAAAAAGGGALQKILGLSTIEETTCFVPFVIESMGYA